MKNINSILALLKRELKISYRNFSSIMSIFIFFLLGIIIFVFSIGFNCACFKGSWKDCRLGISISTANFLRGHVGTDYTICGESMGLF